jgi:hypothetical protein
MLCCFSFATKAVTVAELIQQSKAAVSLGKVTLYADSTFVKHSNTVFEEGEFFEILGQSRSEHDDKDQNQQFRWYKVKTMKGLQGWVFGDAVAVIMNDKAVDYSLRGFHKKSYSFGLGFERSNVWIAALEGHDKNGKRNLFNNIYGEYYLVITNEKGQSVLLNYAEYSATSKGALKNAVIQDITNDNVPEIILERSSKIKETDVEDRTFEVFGFSGGGLNRILEDRLTLLYEEDVPSPAQFKFVEILGNEIRFAYVDYINCEAYQQGFETDPRSRTQERCMEYVTYTYTWDEGLRQFQLIYTPTRMTVEGNVLAEQHLYAIPSLEAKVSETMPPKTSFAIIKSFENIVQNADASLHVEPWLLVQYGDQQGYLPAAAVTFPSSEHGAILQTYYKNPPLYKGKQKSTATFVKVGK